MRRELERLRKVAKAERDARRRAALEEILKFGEGLLDAYSADPPSDPLEVLILSALAEVFARVRELERSRCGESRM